MNGPNTKGFVRLKFSTKKLYQNNFQSFFLGTCQCKTNQIYAVHSNKFEMYTITGIKKHDKPSNKMKTRIRHSTIIFYFNFYRVYFARVSVIDSITDKNK